METAFVIPAESWLSAVKTAAKAMNPKPVIPALANIKLTIAKETITLTASDTETTVNVSRWVPETGWQGEILLDPKLASDPFKGLTKQRLSFTVYDNAVTIEYDEAQVQIPFIGTEEWPEDNNHGEIKGTAVIEACRLSTALDMTTFACAKDETRPIMQGVHLEMMGGEEGLVLTASDGHRLATTKVPGYGGDKVNELIIPRKTLDILENSLKTIDDLKITAYDTFVVIECVEAGITIRGRLLEGKYPNWRQALPKTFKHECAVNKETLLAAVKRMNACSGISKGIKMTFHGGEIVLQAEDLAYSVSGYEPLPCEWNYDEEIKIGFKSEFLISILEKIPGNNVRILLNAQDKAGVFKDDDEDEKKINTTMMLTPYLLNYE